VEKNVVSLDEIKKKQKELEKNGLFKNRETKKEQAKVPEEEKEIPLKLLKELEAYRPTIASFHAWLWNEHNEKISQFMDLIAEDDDIRTEIKKILKELDKQELLVVLEYVYEKSGIGEREREKQKQDKCAKS
jgi:hypothetical protein